VPGVSSFNSLLEAGFESQEEGVEEDVAHVVGEILFALVLLQI
jgi:hypothetical protein